MKKVLFLALLFFSLSSGAYALLAFPYAESICSETSKNEDDIPQDFAFPWSVFSQNIFLQATCDTNDVTVVAGNDNDTQYIWHELYYTNERNTWETPAEFAGEKTADGNWIIGEARATLSLSLGKKHYIAAYICEYEDNKWKCGCRDAKNCTDVGKWSLQVFTQKDTVPETEEETEEEQKEETKQEKEVSDDILTGNMCVPQKQKGQVTYYLREKDDPVSCSYDLDDIPELHGAMNAEQYDNAGVCGACVRVKGPKGSVDIEIVNRCPECKKGHIDLSPAAFEKVADMDQGNVPVEWEYIPCEKKGPVKILIREGSNSNWFQAQVRNFPNPIKSFEYKNEQGEYVALPRVPYNYFSAEKGIGEGPFEFRITDIYDNALLEKDVPMKINLEQDLVPLPACQMPEETETEGEETEKAEEKTTEIEEKQEEKNDDLGNNEEGEKSKYAPVMDKNAYGADSYTSPALKTGDGVFFISPDGNDVNPGTKESPWATISHAADVLTAGQTVYLRGGTYALSGQIVPKNSGTENAWITFAGYPGETPILDASGYNLGSPGFSRDKGAFTLDNGVKYIRIEGITVKNSHGAGISACNASHIIITGNTTDMTFSSGINVPSPTNNGCNGKDITISYNTIINATRMNMKTQGYNGSEAPHEALSIMGADEFEIMYNHIYNSEKEGIDIKEESKNGIIHHNLVENINRQCFYVDAGFAELTNIEFFSNIGRKCGFMGFAISSELGTTLDNIRFHHNLLYNNGGNGIYFSRFGDNGPRANIKIYNNTLYNNGHGKDAGWIGGGISLYSANMRNVDIYDNIVSKSGDFQLGFAIGEYGNEAGIQERNITVHNNIIFGPQTSAHKWESTMQPFLGTNTDIGDPLFVNENNADFTLQKTSPAYKTAENGENKGAF